MNPSRWAGEDEGGSAGASDPVAALELGARRAFAERARVQPGDRQRIASMSAAVLAAAPMVAASGTATLGLGTAKLSLRVLAFAALGAATLGVIAGVAAPSASVDDALQLETPELAGVSRAVDVPVDAAISPVSGEPRESVAQTEAESVAENPAAVAPAAIEPRVAGPAKHPPVQASPQRSAGELLAAANRARRSGERRRARQLYRQLIAAHRGSREAGVARVSLGKLSRPEQARRQFEAYLREYPRGVLAEEASLGRARALGELGSPQEAAAWREFIDDFPASPHAAAARARLADLAR